LTSTDESTFIQTKLSSNGWIGASDDVTYVNAAIAARNDDIAAGIITGESQNLTLGVDKSYANQAAVEGLWY